MQQENFADVLVRASRAAGSLLGLATLLGVEPLRVYRWIARVDEPSDEQRRAMQDRIALFMAEAPARH
jgi:hypothetical protein